MKLLKSVISVLTASMMCCAFSGGAYAESVEKDVDISLKFSARLMEEYGITENSLKTSEGIKQARANSEKVPVFIWCTNDIDHNAAEQKALPILTENIKSSPLLSSVNDVLNSGEELSANAIQNFIEKERAESRAMYEELNNQFIKEHMSDVDIVYVSQYSPVVLAELTLSETIDLAKSNDTLMFEYWGNDEQEDPMDMSVQAANIDDVWSFNGTTGYTGNGVKIGQIENYVPDTTAPQFSGVTTYRSGTTNVDGHATWVASIMVGQNISGYFQGVAPNAELYSASKHDFTTTSVNLNGDLPAIEWLLTNGVNVINASHVFGSDSLNTYGAAATWLDHIAIDHNVTFVQSSGNNGASGIISGGMAYNIITVGNVNDNNTASVSDDTISGTSSYYNDSTHLAYKPDLCAPGTSIRISSSANPASGTSGSAPHVSGSIALLFEAMPQLKLQPATVKAILTASVNPYSTKRYCPGNWSSNTSVDSYAKYGAGLLDAYSTVATAKSGHYYSSNLTPSKPQEEFTINVTAANANVRVSLAYLKNNYWYTGSEHVYLGGVYYTDLQDLDLFVYDSNGTEVGRSVTYYNNVEIVDFTSSQAGTYKIKVRKHMLGLTETVTYGLSWMEVS